MSMYGLTVSETHGKLPHTPLLDRLHDGGIDSLPALPESSIDLYGYAELLLRSGFPEPVLRLPSTEHVPWLDSYIDQLLTRDVESLKTSRDPQRLRQYLEAYAMNTAGVVDQRTLYESAGIAKATGEEYERLLLNLLIVEKLPTWWTNRIKRLMRAPKRYVIDPALALAALRVDIRGLMRDGALLGRMLDTFVVTQLRAELPFCESRPRLFHLRQEQGRHEADLIIEYGGGRIIAIEIKATSAPRQADARHLAWLRDELGDRFIGGVLLHTGPRAFPLDHQIVAAPIPTLALRLATRPRRVARFRV